MSLREELDPYRDEDGLILERPNASPGPETGNGILNKCVEMLLLQIRGELCLDDVLTFNQVISSCAFIDATQYPPVQTQGIYNRGPRKLNDMIGKDDYTALSGTSAIIGSEFSRDIADYGSRHWWSFNNVNPGASLFSNPKEAWQAFQGRFLYLVPYWRMMGGLSVCWPARKLLCAYLRVCGGDESARLQQWFMARALYGRMDDLSEAVKKWRLNLVDQFPNGMKDVMSNYYGASHPFARYSTLL